MYKSSSSELNAAFQSPKKKYKNPFSYFFSKQLKSHTSTIDEQQGQQNLKGGIFGVPLCDASKNGSILWDLRVPDPVALCFQEICKRGLTTEGIFRLSGSTSEVLWLENKINTCSSEERKGIDTSSLDIHTLTSLVKKYLRELPEPVIPNAFHEQFQATITHGFTRQESYQGLSTLILKLPYYNRQLLHAILLMASRIQQHVDMNMMCPEALATVFAPICTGFEQSLKDQMNDPHFLINKHSNNSNYTNTFQKSTQFIQQHIQKNKNWTNIWKLMIEENQSLVALLDKQLYHHQTQDDSNLTWRNHHVYYPQHHHPMANGNRSLPSPFSTHGSLVPLPNDIMMAQFYPIHESSSSTIPIVPVKEDRQQEEKGFHHSISKKTSSFFQKSSSIRKILSVSTLR